MRIQPEIKPQAPGHRQPPAMVGLPNQKKSGGSAMDPPLSFAVQAQFSVPPGFCLRPERRPGASAPAPCKNGRGHPSPHPVPRPRTGCACGLSVRRGRAVAGGDPAHMPPTCPHLGSTIALRHLPALRHRSGGFKLRHTLRKQHAAKEDFELLAVLCAHRGVG